MKKVLLSAVAIAVLVVSFAGIASAAPMSPAQFCKANIEAINMTLEDALYAAHGVEVDINISQGACVSTVATHMGGKVNTQAMAVSFCKEVGAEDLQFCVDHVGPALGGIFHGG